MTDTAKIDADVALQAFIDKYYHEAFNILVDAGLSIHLANANIFAWVQQGWNPTHMARALADAAAEVPDDNA